MALATGTRIGPYKITATIGAGGMGEVYRALDTTLDRDVAIKVLPELLASDPDRVARFSREAKTLASLNHQNIAHIHGVVDPPLALVMEFVDGEDLAQRLARGAIPLDEAIPIAKQIADGLECAHEQGIVHRDLKPANVKVRPDGVVKVLDFGLAKALSVQPDGSPSSSAMLLSPTFTSPAMTQLGIILGTAAYMAPEQARGKAIDKRADVWAFGVVLFEMLSGTRAFEGSEVSDTLAFVLTREPNWTALPSDTPVPIRRLLRRCLQKDRKLRLADIADARMELDEALGATPAAEQPSTPLAVARQRSRIPVVVAALVAGVLLGLAAGWKAFVRPPATPLVTRFLLTLPDGQEFTNTGRHFIGISPDGSRVVYTAGSGLRLRHLSSLSVSDIAGTPNAAVINPVFSPDGESIAFYADNALRRLPVTGGTPFTLTGEFVNPHGIFWSKAGIFAGQAGLGIVRVPEAGGKPEVVVKVDPSERAQGPQLLPDGDTLIFTVHPAAGEQRFDQGKIFAQSLRTGERRLLREGGADGQVLPTGHLVFGAGNVIYAMRFDAKTLTTSGTPIPVLQGVRRSAATGAMMIRVASNGTVTYVPGDAVSAGAPRLLGFVDRHGKVSPLSTPANTFDTPRLSPDGTRIAVAVLSDAGADIWIQDLPVKSELRRLTFGGSSNRIPVWSPDGRQIAFMSNRDGPDSIYVQNADVSGSSAELIAKAAPAETLIPTSWSVGGWLAFMVAKDGSSTVHALSMKDRKIVPVASGPGTLTGGGVFSPDGRWLAYTSFGGTTVNALTFVEPFPGTGAKYQIGQGNHPVWMAGGRELLVNPRTPNLAVYTFTPAPRVTFALAGEVDRAQSLATNSGPRQYDSTADGKRLLMMLPASISTTPTREIRVVMNWFEELKK